jgi:SAM-dependent methyltransferase
LRADARALPLTPAAFDAVVATFPSEYIGDPAALEEIRRVLRPGGTLAVALWAQIEGDSPYLRAVDLAYRLTLQRSPRTPRQPAASRGAPPPIPAAQSHLADTLVAMGMHVTHTTVATRGGLVHYVVAMQPGAEPRTEN